VASPVQAPTPAPTAAPRPAPTPEPTAAPTPGATVAPKLGCSLDVPLVISSHREALLGAGLTLKDAGEHPSSKHWTMADAGQGEVYLTGADGKQLGVDEDGELAESSEKGDVQKWKIMNGGLGKVFIEHQSGGYLQDFRGELKLTDTADEWEKWTISPGDGVDACHFPSVKLFCVTVIRSWGHEVGLMKKQKELGAGIFGCDETMVLSDTKINLGGDFHTTVISSELLSTDKAMHKNSQLFLKIWEKVREVGLYKDAHWVVKTDSDTVFFADRLRARVGGPEHARSHSTFFANCAAKVDVQVQEDDQAHFMYGPLEVFSEKAADTFLSTQHFEKCKTSVGLGESMWEERYLTHCLELMGTKINPHMSLHLLRDEHCDGVDPDCTGDSVAFHNFSSVEAYTACWKKGHGSE